ncbi:MAG: asparagine synthase (glutamine-hydrolyzing) [Peptococcaceae bacterium]|jgi:asparagine synthase (glutamine-hydrolysing)|nr:asparagine synthase (glutamine-hydrolyzing) [Peptococcaceae bacterium]
MCGIAGQIGWQEESIEKQRHTYEQMQHVLRRRGPDQEGIYIQDGAALIHTRLCVVDSENGKQPMQFTRGGEHYVLVYNGELYNTPELRAELEGRGHHFAGYSDTEVLGRAYLEWGEEALSRLNGIFAFAIWETHNRRLFMARDRIGVKPLFYALKGDTLLFASEIKALLAHPLLEAAIDTQSVAELLLIGPGRTPGYGVFCGVEELEPASCAVYSSQGFQKKRYWELSDQENTDSFGQAVEKVRWLVIDAIERQLVSDVPVCTLLSGGLDSSIISSVADRSFRRQGKTLHTFSVDYKDNEKYFTAGKFQPNSDQRFILRMNAYLNAEHHRVLLDTDELVDALYKAVEARDLPGMADVDASLLLFCQEIKKQATVALSGECADEIFGGYPWYRDKEIRERYGFPWAQSGKFRQSFLRPEFAARIDAAGYIDERYQQTLKETSAVYTVDPSEKRMKEMVNLNFRWFMQTLLSRKDHMSMYSSLEVRVPYCDHRIAEYLYTLPWEYKDYQQTEKGLLRAAMSDILPQEVLWRKKSPYPKTHHPAYLAAVSKQLREVIEEPDAPILQIVRKEALTNLISRNDPTPWYGQLMTTPQTIAYFLQMNHWLEKYRVRII